MDAITEVNEAAGLMEGAVPYLTYHRAVERLEAAFLALAGAEGPEASAARERARGLLQRCGRLS